MSDPYLYENSAILRNLQGISDKEEFDLVEAEFSRANMMVLYNEGFDDFSTEGIQKIHKALFYDFYDWAGQFRTINIQKRETIIAGKSVWYSNDENIDQDLNTAWEAIRQVPWDQLTPEDFAKELAHTFPAIWQVHPFREGNTRAVVMLMTFFVEHHGFYFDRELLAASAGYVRNAFVMASLGKYAEYEHLERILHDAISIEPVQRMDDNEVNTDIQRSEKYQRYYVKDYKPSAHEYREDEGPEMKMV